MTIRRFNRYELKYVLPAWQCERIIEDIAPFTIAEGHWAAPRAVNRIGLKRAGFNAAERRNIERAIRTLLDRALTIEEVVAQIESDCDASPQIAHLVKFLTTSERGIARS